MATRNYQTYMGPTDPNLRHSEIEGYQPVSRIGEVVINAGEVVVSSCGNSVFQYYAASGVVPCRLLKVVLIVHDGGVIRIVHALDDAVVGLPVAGKAAMLFGRKGDPIVGKRDAAAS